MNLEDILSIWKFINNNAAGITLVLTIIPLLWAIFQYILIKRKEYKKDQFKTYHKLIEELVSPGDPRLDRQLAVVYELINFKDYYPVSVRILEGLRKDWEKICTGNRGRLIKEMDLTIENLKKKIAFKKNLFNFSMGLVGIGVIFLIIFLLNQ